MPTRAQLEIGLLVAGTLAILILYRNYLQRSLAIQEQQLHDMSEPATSPPAPTDPGNGTAPLFHTMRPPHADG